MSISHTFNYEGGRVTTIIDDRSILESYSSDTRLGYFMAETCARYMDPYIPMDTGMLAQNYTTKPYKVTYTSLYAKRMYEGVNYHFSREKHPLATHHWDQAMIAAKGPQIAREVRAYLNRQGG